MQIKKILKQLSKLKNQYYLLVGGSYAEGCRGVDWVAERYQIQL